MGRKFGLMIGCIYRGEANRARELVVSSRQRRAQETTSMKGRQKSGMPRPGVAPTATDDGNETHDIGGDGRGQKDVETLTKLLEYKTNEAAQARAELAEMRAERFKIITIITCFHHLMHCIILEHPPRPPHLMIGNASVKLQEMQKCLKNVMPAIRIDRVHMPTRRAMMTLFPASIPIMNILLHVSHLTAAGRHLPSLTADQ